MEEAIRELSLNILFLKSKLIEDESEGINLLHIEKIERNIDDLQVRHQKIKQHLKSQNLQNAIVLSKSQQIIPIKSDNLLRLSQQMKSKKSKVRASYPGWYNDRGRSEANDDKFKEIKFNSGVKVDGINHGQYLKNI